MSKKIFEADEAPVQGQPQAPAQATDKPTTATQPAPQKGGSSDEETLKTLTDLMEINDYTDFVQKLSELTSNNNLFPKLKNLILGGEKDGAPSGDEKFTISGEYDQVVTKLIPTQNEIDREKSLSYPIKYPYNPKTGKKSKDPEEDKKTIIEELTGIPVKINKLPIVVFDYQGKTYILDGHHRWSGVYSLNSNGKIKAIKLTSSKEEIDPVRALKAIQLSIASAVNMVPASEAGTDQTNLLLISSNEYTKKYLEDNISEDFLGICKGVQSPTLKLVDKNAVVDYIMKNIDVMQKNGFLKGAPSRIVMPQTDGTEELKSDQNLWKAPLEKGDINVLSPFATESKKWIKTYEQFRRK